MKDLRVKRTYQLLKKALFELLTKKPFEEIKVNDLCDLAMVHRTTFYTHFSDKYELLDFCIHDIELELTNKIKGNQYANLEEFYTNLVMSLLAYMSENKKFFNCILKKNSENAIITIFTNTCISYITTMLKEEEKKLHHEVPIEIIAQFYAGAVVHTVIWWIKENPKLSQKELCNHIISLIFKTPHTQLFIN